LNAGAGARRVKRVYLEPANAGYAIYTLPITSVMKTARVLTDATPDGSGFRLDRQWNAFAICLQATGGRAAGSYAIFLETDDSVTPTYCVTF
jgi:hypothetical protein